MWDASLSSSYARQVFFFLFSSAEMDRVVRAQILNHQAEFGTDFGGRFKV